MIDLYVWDMDHTIIDNDCDVSWKKFLVEKKIAPESDFEEADQFYEDYRNQTLNLDEFLKFQCRDFKGRSVDEMAELCIEHFETYVKKTIYDKAKQTIQSQQAGGGRLILLTATNKRIAQPLALALGFDHVLAYDLEKEKNIFTGNIVGEYSGGQGKVHYLESYLKKYTTSYYGDSSTDIPVMSIVDHPVAVNPVPALLEHAEQNGWETEKY